MSATDWKLEVVPIPVSDVDRAKQFYGEQCGFGVDLDINISQTTRVVQLTPPGSACSIQLRAGAQMVGSARGLQIVVSDLETARKELLEGGVEVSPVRHMEKGVWVDGPGENWNSFVFFSDPDGNEWALQERPAKS